METQVVMNVGGQKIYTGIVSGKELEDVSKAIFGSASTFTTKEASSDTKKIDFSKFNRVDTGIDLFESRTSIQETQNIAKSKTGMGVELSQNTTESLAFLRTEAAKLNSVNTYNKYNVSANIFETKEISNASQASQTLTSKEMNSDKEGSNPFFYVAKAETEKKESKDNTNVSIFS